MVSIFSFYMYNLSVFQKNMKCYSFMPVTVLHYTPTAEHNAVLKYNFQLKITSDMYTQTDKHLDIYR